MTVAVLGVDLASASWDANGTAVLAFEPDGGWVEARTGVVTWPSRGRPTASQLAERIDAHCTEHALAAVSLDGPQGWRDPGSPPGWGRLSERETRTPGKTGPPGTCVPGTYLGWVTLSVETFARLASLPHVQLANEPVDRLEPPAAGRYYLLESFPTSTWRSAGLARLPAKRKAGNTSSYARALESAFALPPLGAVGHDDLQAVVAALPAAALLGAPAQAVPRGSPGRPADGAWIEGLIWDAVPTSRPSRATRCDERPLLVLVTGPPGAGKTTLADPLARELALPLVARDELKELLYAELGTGDLEWTRRLGGASFALLFSIAARLLGAGSSVVLEANFFRGAAEREIERLPAHRLVQVHCSAPAAVVLDRYADRAGRHAGHLDAQRADEVAARLQSGIHDPLDLGGKVFTVDTTEPVNAAEVAAQIRAATAVLEA